MNELTSVLQQGHQLFVQHAPAEILTKAVPAGIIFLIAGIGLSVLGAKFARFGMTGFAVMLGGWGGYAFAQYNSFPPILGAMVGALLVGIIGYQTFRIWVGLGTAIVVGLIAVSVFGQKELRPYLAEFNESQLRVDERGETVFALPTAEGQQVYWNGGFKEYVSSFTNYLADRDMRALQNGRAIGMVALLTGLCVGLMATRWALILSTSLVGTLLVAVGAAALLVQSLPKACVAFDKNPGLAAAGLGGFLITSLILQALLSKRAESSESE